MNEARSFYDLAQSLDRAKSAAGPAEGHGVLAGWLCARGQVDADGWYREVLGYVPSEGDLLGHQAIADLEAIKAQTVSQLRERNLEFQLLLPPDDEPLEDRVSALGEWCQGFLLGFSMGGVRDKASLPSDVDELLTDFVEITKVQAESEPGEEDEDFYAHIVEYVRMGALLIYEELHPVQGSPGLQ